jgi:hypothetical protein
MRHCRRSVYETVSVLLMMVTRLMLVDCSMDLLSEVVEMRTDDL